MTEFTCPNCNGGFPGDALLDGYACPWCEFMFREASNIRCLPGEDDGE